MKYIVFDTETSCLDFEKAEIFQLAVKKIDLENTTIEDLNFKYKTENPLSFEARKRCCILQETVDKYQKFNLQEVMDVLELNNKDVIYIGHNIKFDRSVLIGVINRYNINSSNPINIKETNLVDNSKWIDTLNLAKRHLNSVIVKDISGENNISFALDYLFHYLHLYNENEEMNFHDAMFDVEVTWRLFKWLCKDMKLSPSKNPTEIVRLSNEPFILTYIPFGKYKGEKWTDIYKKDKKYLEWMIRTMDCFDENSPEYDSNIVKTVEAL